ncbi:uncharacterized protein LOC112890725 [Panicum hallii]|uniref:uncharacterized protein LOC112890725 n=1 Tax=Panicum hallii TaxID=206008 RepID=UPI000DF4E36A|nr:uncharacterized protein LOC112890725 [Panicum hallii]
MMVTAQPLSWSDLPPELLGLVLKRLPSLADRVRLRAVCHPWLALLDGTFLSIPDGEIIEMPVPDDACCCGSVDNWLFLVHSDADDVTKEEQYREPEPEDTYLEEELPEGFEDEEDPNFVPEDVE